MTEKEPPHMNSDGDRCRESCGPYQFSEAEKIARKLKAEAAQLVGKYRAGSVSQMFLALNREAGVTLKPELQYDSESKNIHMVWDNPVVFAVLINPRDGFSFYHSGRHPFDAMKKGWLQQFTPEMIEAARRLA